MRGVTEPAAKRGREPARARATSGPCLLADRPPLERASRRRPQPPSSAAMASTWRRSRAAFSPSARVSFSAVSRIDIFCSV